jgi:hypothetical protein
MVGCRSYVPEPPVLEAPFDSASEALDKAKWYVDAYGTGSIGAPLLVQPDDAFKFELKQVTADSLFQSEKSDISTRRAGSQVNIDSSGATVGLSGDLTASQQFGSQLSTFTQAQTTVAEKNRLLQSAAFDQFQADLQSAQSITDPAQKAQAIAAAKTNLANNLPGPAASATNTFPMPPAPPAIPTVAPPTNTSAATLPALLAAQGLFAAGSSPVSGATRSALLMAAGDNATNALLSLLGDPTKLTKFKGKRVLFGATTVSVNPGWRTREGYAADVTGKLTFRSVLARPAVRDAFLTETSTTPVEAAALTQLQTCVAESLTAPVQTRDNEHLLDERTLSNPDGNDRTLYAGVQFAPYRFASRDSTYESDVDASPLVAAVSPIADAQSLDLQSSRRDQAARAVQIALALSAVGANAQAGLFSNAAKQFQGDTETRADNVVVNSYSIAGGRFGFRVMPRLQANPDNGDAKSILNESAFPTLLVIGSDDDDLRPRVAVRRGVSGKPECFVVERKLEFFEEVLWEPLRDRCSTVGKCVGEVLTERERNGALRDLRRAKLRLQKVVDPTLDPPDDQSPLASYMLEQMGFLAGALAGATYDVDLPAELIEPPPAPPPAPTADSVAPTEVVLDRTSTGAPIPKFVTMLVAGADLDQIDLTKVAVVTGDIHGANADGTPAAAPTAKLVGKAIELFFEVESDKEPVTFKLPVKNSTTAAQSHPIAVHLSKDLVIARATDKNKGTDVITFSPGIPDHVVKSEIEKTKEHYPNPSADVKVQVDTQTGGKGK